MRPARARDLAAVLQDLADRITPEQADVRAERGVEQLVPFAGFRLDDAAAKCARVADQLRAAADQGRCTRAINSRHPQVPAAPCRS
jgi:hypothetical protein